MGGMKKKIYQHGPFVGLLVEVLIVVYLISVLCQTFSDESPSILGIALYGLFIGIICMMIYFTDITKIYILNGSKVLVCKRAFPFLFVTNFFFDMPITLRVGRRSAGRGSLVRIHIDDGKDSIPLTRAKVLTPSRAASLIKRIQSFHEQIKCIEPEER